MRVPRYSLWQSYASVASDYASQDTLLWRSQISVAEIDRLIHQMLRYKMTICHLLSDFGAHLVQDRWELWEKADIPS